MRWLLLALAASPAVAADLAGRIDRILRAPAARRAFWGIKVVDLESGAVRYQQNAGRLFAPASNAKLFSTALALTRLGPEYRWITRVAADGPLDEQGLLAGDLVLVGGGDPNLSSRVLPYEKRTQFRSDRLEAVEELAGEVVAAGVRRIEGNVVGDDSHWVWERWADTWALEDLTNEDGPPVTALAVNDNVLTLRLRPGGKPEWDPPVAYYEVDNRLRPGSGALRVRKEPEERVVHVWGEADGPRSVFVAVDDPALYAAQALREALERRGVTILGRVESRHRRPWNVGEARSYPFVLVSRSSWPLAEVVRVTNKVSQNLHAEMLLREVGRVRRGLGTFETSRSELRTLLEELGVGPGDYVLRDGSGLSRQNLVSPDAVVTLLGHMYRSQHRAVWLDSLPEGGVDGTLSSRFLRAKTSLIRAKTGTLTGVSALSGYAERGTEVLAFTILVNNHAAENGVIRGIMDRIVDEIIKY